MRLIFCHILILSLVLISCTTFKPIKQSQAPEIADVLSLLKNQQKQILSLEAEAKMELLQDKRHDRVELVFVAQKPQNAMFEIVGPTGLLALATINKKEFRFFDPKNNRVLFGRTNEKSLANILPILILPEKLVPILTGTPKIDGKFTKIEFDTKLKRYKFDIIDKNKSRQRVWINDDKSIYRIYKSTQNKEKSYVVTYLGWKKASENNLLYPGFIKIEHPHSKSVIKIKLRDKPLFNAEYPEETFSLPWPKNADRQLVE